MSYEPDRLVDQVQFGTVDSVFTARPLNGEVLDQIKIDYNGVVGWEKARSLISFDWLVLVFLIKARITENQFPLIVKQFNEGRLPFYAHQVCLSDEHIVDFIQQNQVSGYRPGLINEQLHIRGVRLNSLHAGSTICIGDSVVLEVVSGRTLCPIFFQHLQFKDTETVRTIIQDTLYNYSKKRLTAPIGIMCRVRNPGIVKLNDSVIADPQTSPYYNKGIHQNHFNMLGPKLEYDYQSQIKWLSRDDVRELYKDDPALLQLTLEEFDTYKIPTKDDCVFYTNVVKDKTYPAHQHIDKRKLMKRMIQKNEN